MRASEFITEQVSAKHIFDLAKKIHRRLDDFSDGDLTDRIYWFDEYTLTDLPVSKINTHEFDVDEDLVAKHIAKIMKSTDTMPPIIYDPVAKSIIDGIHRVNAYKKLGYKTIPAYVGSKKSDSYGQSETYESITEDENGKLAWRIRFRRFKDLSPLMPERENKIYLMPTDHSALRTFGNLTGKDDEKITKMPTEAYLVSGDARVGDMSIINAIHRELQTTKDQERIEKLKKLYLNTSIPYNQYRPGIFKYPEILAEPSQLTKLDKSVVYDKNTGEIAIKDKK